MTNIKISDERLKQLAKQIANAINDKAELTKQIAKAIKEMEDKSNDWLLDCSFFTA